MSFPDAHSRFVAARTLTDAGAAFLELDADLKIRGTGGNLRLFGPAELEEGTPLDEVAPFTVGLQAPGPGAEISLPRVTTSPSVWVDVHLFKTPEGFGLLLEDVSDAVRREAELLQKANELALMKRSPGAPDYQLRTLFSTLNLLVARFADNRLIPLGDLPAWGGRFVPILDAPLADWDEDASLAFLGTFLKDAAAFWQQTEIGSLPSGVWISDDLDGTEFLYEATAAYTGDLAVLLITRSDSASAEKQQLIQTGRNLALQHKALDRDHGRLERANDRLETRARARRKDLEATNARLEASLKRRSELEEERAAMIEQAQQAQRVEALGTLAGGIAHDFNNVLAAILGYAELGKDPLASPDVHLDYFASIEEAALRARDLIRQILVMTRRTEAAAETIRVREIAQEVERMLRATLPSDIRLDVQLEADTMIQAAPTELHQILMNLCTNAAQAMRDGGGALKLTLEEITLDERAAERFPELEAGSFAMISVRDTGEGIEPAVLPRIFTPFFTTKSAGEGTGIGLSVVHGIVRSAGGLVTVESQPGFGSVFTIYWPTAGEEAAEAASDPPADVTGTERILFIDDEPMQAEVATQMLGRLGYGVTCFTSSVSALEAFKGEPQAFDLVISDLAMPELDGATMLREMLALRPDLPVIVLSGDLAANVDRLLSETGAQRYLLKPVHWRRIAEVMRELLDT